jgi:hypothetical protein
MVRVVRMASRLDRLERRLGFDRFAASLTRDEVAAAEALCLRDLEARWHVWLACRRHVADAGPRPAPDPDDAAVLADADGRFTAAHRLLDAFARAPGWAQQSAAARQAIQRAHDAYLAKDPRNHQESERTDALWIDTLASLPNVALAINPDAMLVQRAARRLLGTQAHSRC